MACGDGGLRSPCDMTHMAALYCVFRFVSHFFDGETNIEYVKFEHFL